MKFKLFLFVLLIIATNVLAQDFKVEIKTNKWLSENVKISLGKQEYQDNNLYQWVHFTSVNHGSMAGYGCRSIGVNYYSYFVNNGIEYLITKAEFALRLDGIKVLKAKKKLLLMYDLPPVIPKNTKIKVSFGCATEL